MLYSREAIAGLAILLSAVLPAPGLAQASTGPQEGPAAGPDSSAPNAPAPDSSKAPAPAPRRLARTAFSWASPQGDFKISLNGRIQASFERYDSGRLPQISGPAPQDLNSFRLRRSRLAVSGYVYSPKLLYKVQVELAGSALSLRDAFVTWKMKGNDAQLSFGQLKAPLGRQELTSIFKQQAVDRSRVSDTFAHGWDAGIMLFGTPRGGRFEYYVGTFNGEGRNKGASDDARPMGVARLVWAPLGSVGYTAGAVTAPEGIRFALGVNGAVNGGWLMDVNGTSGLQAPSATCDATGCTVSPGDDASIRTLGADVAATVGGRFSITGEVFSRRVTPEDGALARRTDHGWYADAGWMAVPGRHEVGIRYGRLDGPADVREVTPFYSYYLAGHDLKVQADYTRLSTYGGPDTIRDHRFRVQFLATF